MLLLDLLVTILANTLGLYAASRLVAGVHFTGGFLDLLLAGALLGIMFAVLKPVLRLLALPLLLLTLGLFSLVLNGLLLWLLTILSPSIIIESLAAYVWATLIVTIINLLAHRLSK